VCEQSNYNQQVLLQTRHRDGSREFCRFESNFVVIMAAVVDAVAQGIDKLSVKDGVLPPPPNGREVVIGIDLGELRSRALWLASA
jgi:hypothetical protein